MDYINTTKHKAHRRREVVALKDLKGITFAQLTLFSAHKLKDLKDFQTKTIRETWLICAHGGFSVIIKALIDNNWRLKDCSAITLHSLLRDETSDLKGIDTLTKRALRDREATSLTILQKLTADDLIREVRPIGKARAIYLNAALESECNVRLKQ